MLGQVIIDTMYLTIKYPKKDVFEKWNYYTNGVDRRKLREGLAVGDFLVRPGGSGYKISVWNHDARVFLTDDVDEKRGDGNGMGIWVQLGPKFLIVNGPKLQFAVRKLLRHIGLKEDHPTRISRIDIAMDLFGESMQSQNLEDWRNKWVGRSKVSKAFFNSRSGDLETICIGSRESAVYLRIYDKRAQATKDNDLIFWVDVWGGVDDEVTRIEWEVKPKDGNFEEFLSDFSKFNGFSARELLNYLLDWGRLAEPDISDTNRSRWLDSEFWQGLRGIASQWADGVDWPVTRFQPTMKPMSEAYAKQLAGVLAGAMARSNPIDPNVKDMFEELKGYHTGIEVIKRKALAKSEILLRSE